MLEFLVSVATEILSSEEFWDAVSEPVEEFIEFVGDAIENISKQIGDFIESFGDDVQVEAVVDSLQNAISFCGSYEEDRLKDAMLRGDKLEINRWREAIAKEAAKEVAKKAATEAAKKAAIDAAKKAK